MGQRQRRLLAVTAVALAAAGVAAGLLLARPGASDSGAGEAVALAERRPAPELIGEVLVAPPVRLAELRGTPVLVNFWASWCLPCREEAPHLARFDGAMRERARLVGVDIQDTRSDALAFVREFDWRFPNVSDPRAELAARYRLAGLPTTYVIDREGRIALTLTGAQTFASLARALEEVE